MIIGNINESDFLNHLFRFKYLDKILTLINDIQTKNLEDGVHEIIDRDLLLIITTYITADKTKRPAEIHKKYIDFQYILYGEEYVGYTPLNSIKTVLEPYNEEKDMEKYGKVENESHVFLKNGMLAIFCPNDIHRPGIITGDSRHVRKFVFKIAI